MRDSRYDLAVSYLKVYFAATWFRSFLQRTANSKAARFGDMRKNARQFLQNLKTTKK